MHEILVAVASAVAPLCIIYLFHTSSLSYSSFLPSFLTGPNTFILIINSRYFHKTVSLWALYIFFSRLILNFFLERLHPYYNVTRNCLRRVAISLNFQILKNWFNIWMFHFLIYVYMIIYLFKPCLISRSLSLF